MSAVREALEAERKAELEFVAEARQSESAPKGWPAALNMFHIGMWRERMRNALTEISEGRSYGTPPESVDELNDAELPGGIGTPLTDAAARADHLLGEIMDLYERLGEKSFDWYSSKNTTEAVLRNSYVHPREHLFAYLKENGLSERAIGLWEEGLSDMQKISAPPIVMGAVLCDAAIVRVMQDRHDEALAMLEESLSMRPDLRARLASDPDFDPVRDDPRFQELAKR